MSNDMTQERLGELAGLPRTSVILVENGKQALRAYTLVLISDALRVPMLDLLSSGDDPAQVELTTLGAGVPRGIRAWVESTQELAAGNTRRGGMTDASANAPKDRGSCRRATQPARRPPSAGARRGDRKGT